MKWALVFAMCSQRVRKNTDRPPQKKVAIDSFKNGRTKDLSQL